MTLVARHISINEAVETGVTKLRLDNWADPKDHIEIYIDFRGKPCAGPWVKFWSLTLENVGLENPYYTLITEFDPDDKRWSRYVNGKE